ncbi:translation initiation factor eIF-2B subunit alpha [Coccinella septempunctata]|uniref:translation initiation factor eIF-2B subunit alpha n=1 Tax=Coccinella septempunctata TaxID=41139 RepID=UPI001D081AF5|nr:translation initiation factor eIF-2B subunit alpha [Coccinella septempunctata]
MEEHDIREYFCNLIKQDEDVSVGVAAIKTLMEIIKKSESSTIQGLDENLKQAITIMKNANYPVAAINSGCELFRRFITLAQLDTDTFEECRNILLSRGNLFITKLNESRDKIVKFTKDFIRPRSKILTHSRSRVVLQAFKDAAKREIEFEVFVTISEPDRAGLKMCKELEDDGIPCTAILDSAVAYVMEQVDFVMVGAECVAESGGIVNKVGTFPMAICAKELKKRFYVLVESFKFSRIFPLNNRDIPKEYKYINPDNVIDLKRTHPLVDYTPPTYITLLFTDLGILTTSGVSDELIRLYI